jgi:hypothetical protein
MPLKEMKTLKLFAWVASIFLHTPNDIIHTGDFSALSFDLSVFSDSILPPK